MTTDSSSRSLDAPLYWGFVGLLVLGLFAMPAFPSQDGPIHLYNFSLIESLAAGDATRSAFHRIAIESPTNIALPWLGSVLTKWVSPAGFERALLAIHLLAVAAFAVAWRRANRCAPYPAAWAGLAFAFPWSLFMGFYSFQLASDLALLFLVGFTTWRERSLVFLLGASLAMGALVMLFHAVAAALLAALLALFCLVDTRRSPGERLRRAAAVSAPILLLLAITLAGGSTAETSTWQWSSPANAILYLTTFGGFVFQGQWLVGFAISATFLYFCAHAGTISRLPFVCAGAALLVVLHLLLPDVMAGGGYLTGRFAWWIPLLLLPAFDAGESVGGANVRRWLAPTLAIVSLAITALFAWPSAVQVAEVRSAASEHPIEGRISAAIFDRDPRSDANLEPLRHLVAWFAMESGVVTTNYQARERFFPVRLTERAQREWPDVDINQAWETDWARLPLDAVLAIDADPADRQRLARNFDSVWIDSAERVELWHRK